MNQAKEEGDLNQRRHAALESLRPLCVLLMKNSSKKLVQDLNDALHLVDDRVTQEIQQYILFPIQSNLRFKDLPEAILCDLCKALTLIFQKSEVASLGTFCDTFNPLMFTLTPNDGSNRVVFEFEETKIALIETLSQLFKATQEVILCQIYSTKFIPALGQFISVLIGFAELERSREVQQLALDCILRVLQHNSKYGKKYTDYLAAFFPFCLPGLSMAACKIATGDSKQGHSVIIKSMEVFTSILTLVMSDESLERVKEKGGNKPKLSEDDNPMLQKLMVDRSEEWVKVTGSKVKVLVDRLCGLVSSDNWRVRLGLASACDQMLIKCTSSLAESLPKILETLVALINDPYGNVACKAQSALQAFSKASESDKISTQSGQRTLLQILEDNLYALSSSLPRQIRMCDEDDKPSLIRLLNGYIKLLGQKINCVVNSSPHLSRLCIALVQALELDTTDLCIVEERGVRLTNDPEVLVTESSSNVWKPRKFFKHFRDENILSELLKACQQLGRYGNIHTLVEHMLDLGETSCSYGLAATLIINEMVIGAARLGEESQDPLAGNSKECFDDATYANNLSLLPDVICMLMEEYLSSENQRSNSMDHFTDDGPNVPLSHTVPSLSSSLVVLDAAQAEQSNRVALNRNIIIMQTCLYLEGLGKFAQVLGPRRQDHLKTSLYPLVENLGHENLYLSSTAYASLIEVALATGHSGLDSLLRENADYLVSSVSLRLRHLQQYPRTPQTLCVMLKFCSKELLPHVKRSVLQLLDSLDDHYTDDLVLFMPVLLELMTAILRWFPIPAADNQAKQESFSKSTAVLDPTSMVNYLTDYMKTKRHAEGDFDDEENQGETTLEDIEREMKASSSKEAEPHENENMDENEKEVPVHVTVVKEVFQRVRNLLSTGSGRLRVQALDVVTQGFHCLRGHERELLPQVHQMWAGLRPLFNCQEKFIVVKAVKTLLDLSESAGDFLRQRSMKEIIPSLSAYMTKQVHISRSCHSGYLHTANFKLQACVLTTVGHLATNLQLDGRHVDQISHICLPYLSDTQPQALQQASLESMSRLACLEPDAVWLSLIQIYSPRPLDTPGPDFLPLKVPPAAIKSNEYSTNICELFKRHYHIEHTS